MLSPANARAAGSEQEQQECRGEKSSHGAGAEAGPLPKRRDHASSPSERPSCPPGRRETRCPRLVACARATASRACLGEPRAQRRIVVQAPDRGAERRGVAGGDDEPVALVADEAAGGGADGVGGDDGAVPGSWPRWRRAPTARGRGAWGSTVRPERRARVEVAQTSGGSTRRRPASPGGAGPGSVGRRRRGPARPPWASRPAARQAATQRAHALLARRPADEQRPWNGATRPRRGRPAPTRTRCRPPAARRRRRGRRARGAYARDVRAVGRRPRRRRGRSRRSERAAEDVRRRARSRPQRAPQHERHAAPGGRRARRPAARRARRCRRRRRGSARRGERVDLALGRRGGAGRRGPSSAAGGVVRAAAEQRELDALALVQRRERARAVRRARGWSRTGPGGSCRSASS